MKINRFQIKMEKRKTKFYKKLLNYDAAPKRECPHVT